MSIKWRLYALVAALLIVELASFWKLAHFLTWTTDYWLAYTSAFAFICLLLGSIIALASSIPDSMRKQVYLGGVWLFAVQGLANVTVAFQYGLSALPAEVISEFFNVGPDLALKAMAVVSGATLSACSMSFWSVVGQMLRDHWDRQRSQREQLKDIERILEEVKR